MTPALPYLRGTEHRTPLTEVIAPMRIRKRPTT